MAPTQDKPYHWLRQISPSLLKINHIPQFGYSPAFPFEEFFQRISEHFQLPKIQFELSSFRLLSAEQLHEMFNDDTIYFDISLASVSDSFKWAISKQHLKQIMTLLLDVDINKARDIDESFFEGFKNFLAYELSFIYSQISFNKKLDPKIKFESGLNNEEYLCHDLSLDIKNSNIPTYLLFSNEFLKNWRALHGQKNVSFPPVLSEATLPVQLIGGQISLMRSEWKNISLGDFILLDQCTIDPQNKEGQVVLTIDQIPFFNASIEQNKIKILNKDVFQEAPPPMTKRHTPEEDEDEDLFEDEDSDFEDLDFDDFDEDFDEDEEEDLKKNPHEEEELEDEDVREESPHAEVANDVDSEEKEIEKTPSLEKAPIQKIEDIPVNIAIEIARLEMTIQKLSDLQPGNLLELENTIESEVDLVLNGRRIARGELLRIGDHLGVRILELS